GRPDAHALVIYGKRASVYTQEAEIRGAALDETPDEILRGQRVTHPEVARHALITVEGVGGVEPGDVGRQLGVADRAGGGWVVDRRDDGRPRHAPGAARGGGRLHRPVREHQPVPRPADLDVSRHL